MKRSKQSWASKMLIIHEECGAHTNRKSSRTVEGAAKSERFSFPTRAAHSLMALHCIAMLLCPSLIACQHKAHSHLSPRMPCRKLPHGAAAHSSSLGPVQGQQHTLRMWPLSQLFESVAVSEISTVAQACADT